jgi:type II secretory ATPase GspE/PulE/Tfp pilus assembly ATPase PilB-like protein
MFFIPPRAPLSASARRWLGTLALSVGFLFAWANPLLAAGGLFFPRGPGFYFSIPKLLAVLAVYFAWMATCRWIDRDLIKFRLPINWNFLLSGCGLLGLLIVWLSPWFLASFSILLLLFVVPSLVYVSIRNKLAPRSEQVLTQEHLHGLVEKYLKFSLRPKARREVSEGPPVEFISKERHSKDPSRVARAATSKGFLAAKEMIFEAISKRATDIHLEPTKEEMSVRYRVDGILHSAKPFTRTMGDAVINIFKVLAELDITEKRKPQDGSLSALVRSRDVDFRVSTAGSVVGEKMVMRILDNSQQLIDLEKLGMRQHLREHIRSIVTQPHGMFIACGPTGAGKSTTLYACLKEIDRFQKNVITLENPVEYHIENVTQIEINLKAGKTFASELRSLLRQDPDVIYVGEIRDQETAEIACQAAQTGHMVFTTLHANDTVTALGRLIDLGVQPFMVADSVTAILGQRLVRLLCPECKVRYKPNAELLRKANLPVEKINYFYRPPDAGADDSGERVCEHCGGTGYHGRTGIFEFLPISDRIKDMIRENPNLNGIRHEAVKNGMKYLQEDGLRQVIEGRTSIQELLRVAK